jgi:release factor glutamine methyltransferase
VIAETAERLARAGVDSPRLDAEILLAHVLGVDRTGLLTRGDDAMTDDQRHELESLVARREAREPIAYIAGTKGFRNIDLRVDRRVLIPRPDTETLVEVAVDIAPPGGHVHDVGTGSGAVALAIAQERRDLRITASDTSPGAVDLARENAAALGFDVAIDVALGLPPGDYDLVVANLPYVREDEWDDLEPEIRDHEPRDALVSGADGLDAIRSLVDDAESGTLLALEHAPGQADAVRAMVSAARTVQDLAGRDRVTIGEAP